MTMDQDLEFLFYQGRQPVQGAKVSYLEHPNFFYAYDDPIYDENPYHT